MARKNGQEPVDIEHFVNDLKTVVQDGEDLLKATLGTAREKATAGMKTTDEKVRQFPYHSLGIAFGIGLLVGVLTSTSFRSRSSDTDYEEEEDYN
jgi:ElaB/YqjD/DUF883 family membrane-anchored ribosome-binding protein